MKKLGIIGGVGPAATAQLFARVVAMTQASCDQEHLDITVLCRSQIPDRTAFILGKPHAASFVEPMQQAARELEDAGCAFLALPCNTAHARWGDIASVLTHARLLDMLAETAHLVDYLGCKRVGILATDGSLSAQVYQNALSCVGVQALVPKSPVQQEVMSIIYDRIKAGKDPEPERFPAVCNELIESGCDGLILGCTELSLLGCGRRFAGVPLIDALDVLAWRCVVECGAPAYDLLREFTA